MTLFNPTMSANAAVNMLLEAVTVYEAVVLPKPGKKTPDVTGIPIIGSVTGFAHCTGGNSSSLALVLDRQTGFRFQESSCLNGVNTKPGLRIRPLAVMFRWQCP